MNYRKICSITILGVIGGVGGAFLGGVASWHIIHFNTAPRNTIRWYMGNFAAVIGLVIGSIWVPYKCTKYLQ